MSHCGLLAALTIILYGAPATFLCDSITLISACSSSSSSRSAFLGGVASVVRIIIHLYSPYLSVGENGINVGISSYLSVEQYGIIIDIPLHLSVAEYGINVGILSYLSVRNYGINISITSYLSTGKYGIDVGIPL